MACNHDFSVGYYVAGKQGKLCSKCGNPEREKKTDCCVICGFCDSDEDRKKYGNYIVYRNGEPVCRACEEDNTMCLDCGIKPSNCAVKD